MYRVIQWATGNIGKLAIRGVVRHPNLELVGLWVHSKDKVGRDAGELAGIEPTGILATDDVDQVLSLEADCVVYCPLLPYVDELCHILESGKNVVTPCGYYYPYKQSGEDFRRLEEACRKGEVSLHGTGINPGGVSDKLPLMLSALCTRIDSIEVDEYGDCRSYEAPDMVYEIMLFGKTREEARESPMVEFLSVGFRQSIDMVAAGLGLKIEGYESKHEIAIATEPIEVKVGVIKQGTVAGHRFTHKGLVGGSSVITARQTWIMGTGDKLDQDWHLETDGWVVQVHGNPDVRLQLNIYDFDTHQQVKGALIATAMHAVNAIPDVCKAPSGVRSYLDLPMAVGKMAQSSPTPR